jgi:tetratricopeptide (TPR) repeat protein
MKWLGIIALPLGACALYALLQQHLPAAACAHLAGVLCGVLSARRIPPRNPNDHHLYEWLTALCLPCFGGFAVWLTVLASRGTPRTNLAEEYSSYIDAGERSAALDIPELQYYLPPAPTDVEPIIQVLQSPAEDWEKRNAVEALLRLETPESIQMLKAVLKKGSPEVKIYAASALSKLEERLALRMSVLQQRLADTPEDQTAPYALALAQVYMDYIFFDMIDITRRAEFIEAAITQAQSAWKTIREPVALLIIAQARLYQKEYNRAARKAERFLENTPDNVNALLVLAEARFHLGEYKKVQQACRALKETADLPGSLADAIKIWI